MRTRTVFALCSLASMGCTALIGVRDIYLDENSPNGGEDGGASSSSSGNASSSSGGNGDAGTDGPIVCNADFQTSKEHCGRCGHNCGGGECTAGKCQPVQISTVAAAPLQYIVTSDDFVFVSTLITLTTQAGGLWRISKGGGAAELYSTLRYASNMQVLGDKIYFVVEDEPGDGGPDQTGGLYVCPVTGAAPCPASRIVGADNPRGISLDGTRIVFIDTAIGQRAYDTVGNQTTTLNDFSGGRYLYADGTATFYNFTYFQSQPYTARTIEVFPDGGYQVRHEYTKNNASAGSMVGTKEALYIAAFDWEGATTGGVVHRYPRTGGGLPCDYGGTTSKRPYGITLDAQRIYWTNMGVGTDEPFTGGSLVTCELAGCCTTPDTLWTGDGMPGGITNDPSYVYWVTEASGGVWKIAKP